MTSKRIARCIELGADVSIISNAANESMATVILKLVLWIVGLAALIMSLPLVVSVLLDTFGTEGSAIVVLMLFAILGTVRISQLRRKKTGRAGPQTLRSGREDVRRG